MKIRGSNKSGEKIEPQMAPMIDVVFQLLIFFMLTLKIIEPEGNFEINMPIGAPDTAVSDVQLTPIKIRLKSDKAGNLVSMEMSGTRLGNDDAAFERLNTEILQAGGGLKPDPETGLMGLAFSDDLEVEIDADYELNYRYTMAAVSAVRGKLDRSVNPPSLVNYVEKIKFAPPREPQN